MPIFTPFNQLNPNNMKIELRKLSINTRMSEETVCFVADVYIEGVKAGTASNQGHGGSTSYHHLNTDTSKMLIKNAETFCKGLPPVTSHGITIPMDLELYIDNLVEQEDNKKAIKQFELKTQKACLKSICYGVRGKEFRSRGWKGRTIAEIMALPKGPEAIANLIKDIKATLKPNEEILNTNLGDLLK